MLRKLKIGYGGYESKRYLGKYQGICVIINEETEKIAAIISASPDGAKIIAFEEEIKDKIKTPYIGYGEYIIKVDYPYYILGNPYKIVYDRYTDIVSIKYHNTVVCDKVQNIKFSGNVIIPEGEIKEVDIVAISDGGEYTKNEIIKNKYVLNPIAFKIIYDGKIKYSIIGRLMLGEVNLKDLTLIRCMFNRRASIGEGEHTIDSVCVYDYEFQITKIWNSYSLYINGFRIISYEKKEEVYKKLSNVVGVVYVNNDYKIMKEW